LGSASGRVDSKGLAALVSKHFYQEAKATTTAPQAPKGVAPEAIRIRIHTSRGKIDGAVFAKTSPLTAANFLNLASKGVYNGVPFHSVVPGMLTAGGDPLGTGQGSPGYNLKCETSSRVKHDQPGMLSMVRNGSYSNGSQFIITHCAIPEKDGKNAVFGLVSRGMDVVAKIRPGDKITKIEIYDDTSHLFYAQRKNIESWNKTLLKNKLIK